MSHRNYADGWECSVCGLMVQPAKRHNCPQVISQEKYVRLQMPGGQGLPAASVNCPLCDWQRDVQVDRFGVCAFVCKNRQCGNQRLYRLDRWDPTPALPAPSRFTGRGPFGPGDTTGT